jgi:hypothetical protein
MSTRDDRDEEAWDEHHPSEDHARGPGYDADRGYGEGQSGYATVYPQELHDRSDEAMGYGGYGPDEKFPAKGKSGYGGSRY